MALWSASWLERLERLERTPQGPALDEAWSELEAELHQLGDACAHLSNQIYEVAAQGKRGIDAMQTLSVLGYETVRYMRDIYTVICDQQRQAVTGGHLLDDVPIPQPLPFAPVPSEQAATRCACGEVMALCHSC